MLKKRQKAYKRKRIIAVLIIISVLAIFKVALAKENTISVKVADESNQSDEVPDSLTVTEVTELEKSDYTISEVKTDVVVHSDNWYKEFIYQHESGGVPCKINGGAVDCNYTGNRACGLGQSLPCSKLTSVCDLADVSCQEEWFYNYMINRYGSWENAYLFWIAHRWW